MACYMLPVSVAKTFLENYTYQRKITPFDKLRTQFRYALTGTHDGFSPQAPFDTPLSGYSGCLRRMAAA